jgi:hypothetical protein
MVLPAHRPGHAIMQRGSMLHVRRVPASAANLRPHGEQNSQELVAAVSGCCSLLGCRRFYDMLQTARGLRAKTGRGHAAPALCGSGPVRGELRDGGGAAGRRGGRVAELGVGHMPDP